MGTRMDGRGARERFVADWEDWKAVRERFFADPVGWLALVSLDWLGEAPQRYGDLPGLWWQDADAACLDPAGGKLAHRGAPVTEVARFALEDGGAGTRVTAGDLEIEIVRRSGYLIRVHDPKAPALREFRGIPSYAPDPDWVLTGTFEPFDAPRPTRVGTVVEGLGHVDVAPGTVRFRHKGAEHTLTAFNGRRPGTLQILFTDETSGQTTYAANRSMFVAAPDPDGTVRLDFNRATNMPCAFTDFATCPLPPAGNHLPFRVTAGEQIPYERRA